MEDDKRRIDDLSGPVTVEAVIADLRAITQSRKKKAFQGYPHLISYRLKQLRALYEQRHYGKLTRAEEHYLQQLSNALYSVQQADEGSQQNDSKFTTIFRLLPIGHVESEPFLCVMGDFRRLLDDKKLPIKDFLQRFKYFIEVIHDSLRLSDKEEPNLLDQYFLDYLNAQYDFLTSSNGKGKLEAVREELGKLLEGEISFTDNKAEETNAFTKAKKSVSKFHEKTRDMLCEIVDTTAALIQAEKRHASNLTFLWNNARYYDGKYYDRRPQWWVNLSRRFSLSLRERYDEMGMDEIRDAVIDLLQEFALIDGAIVEKLKAHLEANNGELSGQAVSEHILEFSYLIFKQIQKGYCQDLEDKATQYREQLFKNYCGDNELIKDDFNRLFNLFAFVDRDTDPRDAEELAQIKQRLREKGIKVSMLIHDIEGYVNDRLLEIRGTVIAELDKLRLQIHRVASLLGLPCCLFEAAAESVSDKAKNTEITDEKREVLSVVSTDSTESDSGESTPSPSITPKSSASVTPLPEIEETKPVVKESTHPFFAAPYEVRLIDRSQLFVDDEGRTLRCMKLNATRQALIVASGLSINEGVVAGVGTGSVALGVPTMVLGALSNYTLVIKDTEQVLEDLYQGNILKDKQGRELSLTKKAAVYVLGGAALSSGLSLASLGWDSCKNQVMRPLLLDLGASKMTTTFLGPMVAAWPVGFIFIGLTCLLIDGSVSLVRDTKWVHIQKKINKQVRVPWRELSGTERAQAVVRGAVNTVFASAGIGIAALYSFVDYKIFKGKLPILFSEIPGVKASSTLIASKIISGPNSGIFFIFNAPKTRKLLTADNAKKALVHLVLSGITIFFALFSGLNWCRKKIKGTKTEGKSNSLVKSWVNGINNFCNKWFCQKTYSRLEQSCDTEKLEGDEAEALQKSRNGIQKKIWSYVRLSSNYRLSSE
ncbi:hypothetical protein [Coxiella burnetii]|uniref:hypothetical protein n=1 Tax=Coxiella burnetii TaxID=777 RepID=UPI0021559DA1|nr:hypothetical protein [Coxiella burnetii]